MLSITCLIRGFPLYESHALSLPFILREAPPASIIPVILEVFIVRFAYKDLRFFDSTLSVL